MLRSINVGGRNRLPMADLRAIVGSLGFDDVATYLQSGNVVFSTTGAARAAAKAIEAAINASAGLEVPVVARRARDLAAVLGSNPYREFEAEPTTVHVTFLDTEPDADGLLALERRADDFGGDRFEAIGTEVFLYCPKGYGETKLTNAFLERQLGTTATTRNWRTVTALAEMVGAAR